jgi:ferric iron reductase protein FhuF
MNNNAFKISLTYNQVLELVRQLPKKDKAKLSNELAKEATDKRLSRLLSAFRTDEISEDEINKEVEKARAAIYAKKQNN